MVAPVTYIGDWLDQRDASPILNWLWTELPWENREGAPRRECWFNPYDMPYTYGSGEHARTYEAHPFDDSTHAYMVKSILDGINEKHGTSFDCCFVNGYAHGRQHLGWHADDSPEMDMDHPIAVVSLGAAREIWFRQKVATTSPYDDFAWGEPQDQLLGHGSLLLMHAGMQRDWQHRIPKSPLGDACGARLSLTFRRLVR